MIFIKEKTRTRRKHNGKQKTQTVSRPAAVYGIAVRTAWIGVGGGGEYAEGAQAETGGMCDHHPEHTADCGYREAEPGQPCGHEHTVDCYTDILICGHDEEDGQTESENDETHEHTQGCYKLDCPHKRGMHDDECGYTKAVKGRPCGYVCEICRTIDSGMEENVSAGEGVTSSTEETASGTEETASSTEETTSSTEETASSTEETASSTEETASGTEETTSSTEETTRSTEETTSSTEETTISMEGTNNSTEKAANSAGESVSNTEETIVGNTLPVPEQTEPETVQQTGKTVILITDFDSLDAEVQNRLVPAGTEWDALALPATLRASGYLVTDDTEQLPEALTVKGITWEIDPDNELNDGNSTYSPEIGSYCLTPVLPEGYELESGVELPEIYVMIDGQVATLAYDGSVYSKNDVDVINAIIDNNGLTGFDKDDPAGWSASGNMIVTWNSESPKRIDRLALNSKSLRGTLDVSGLTKLERLNCNSNQLTGLTVTGLASLTSLDCSYNRKLAELDVTSNTALTSLYCNGNNLATLDVSAQRGLTSLDCYENPIAFLKLSDDKQLTVSSATGGTVRLTWYTHSTKSVSLTATAEDGYTFQGWTTTGTNLSDTTTKKVTFTLDNVITVTPIFSNPNADKAAVAAAKSAIEGGSYTVAQANAGTKEALQTALTQQINNLPGMSATGITVTASNITVSNFSGATAGNADNKNGTNGSFSFTVALSKGTASDTTTTKDGTITATAYTDPNDTNNDGYHDGDVAVINAIIENNGLSADKDDPAGWGTSDIVTWNSEAPKRIIELSLGDGNLEGALNLSGLTALTTLECYRNNLTELDVTNLASLTALDCHTNQLRKLELAGLTNLARLVCDENKLTKLDVSGQTNLTWLLCDNNPLTFLKLGDGKELTVGSAAGGTVKLTAYTHSSKSVGLTATAKDGYTFQKWTATGTTLTSSIVNPVTFTLDSVITLMPVFNNPNEEAVTDANSGGGSSSDGSDSGSSSSVSSGITVQSPATQQPEIPITGIAQPLEADENGSVTVTDDTVSSAINAAKQEAQRMGNTKIPAVNPGIYGHGAVGVKVVPFTVNLPPAPVFHNACGVKPVPFFLYLLPAGDRLPILIIQVQPGVVLRPALYNGLVHYNPHEPVQNGGGLCPGGAVPGTEPLAVLTGHYS